MNGQDNFIQFLIQNLIHFTNPVSGDFVFRTRCTVDFGDDALFMEI